MKNKKNVKTAKERHIEAQFERLSTDILNLLEPSLTGPCDTDVFAVTKEIDELYKPYSSCLSRSQLIQLVTDRIDDMRWAGEQTLNNCDALAEVFDNIDVVVE